MAVYPKFRNQADDELKKIQQPLNNLPVNGEMKQPANETQSLLMGQRPPRPDAASQPQQQPQYSAQGLANPYMKNAQAPAQPPKQPDITQGEAYKTALQQSRDLLSGKLPTGIQAGESAQLEALKKQQGDVTDQTREQYIKAGLGQSGAFVEGMGADKNQQLREQIALGRDQNAARANIQLQQQQQGMQGLQTLIGAEQAQTAQQAQERLSYANLSLEDKKLAQQGMQFGTEMEFKKWATEAGIDQDKQKLLWQSIENEKSRTSQEKVAFAGLSLEDRKLAQQGMQFGSELDFKKWATTSGIDAEKQKLLWQSIENEKQIQSQEKLAFAGLNLEDKKLAQQGMQFGTEMDFKKWATTAGLDAEKQKLLWQSIENEKKIQSEEKLAFAGLTMEDKKLAQNAMQFGSKLDFDKYALQAGIDQEKAKMIWQATENEKARLSAEKIAFADLDYKNKALAQEGMQFASKLDFDKWATQSGLDMKQKEMIWQSGEAEKERLSRENMFYKELDTKERELLHRIGMDTSKLALEEYAVKEGFNQQQIDRIFKAGEMERDRQNTLTLKTMDTDIEKWKQVSAENLTKQGWTFQEAMAQKEIEAKKYLQARESELQREIETGRLSMQDKQLLTQMSQFKDEMAFKNSSLAAQMSEAEKDRVWKSQERIQSQISTSLEADLDRQLQKQIESGRLSLQEKQMVQQATQFKDEMAFKNSQLASTLSEAEKDRIWKSKENAVNLAHDANMKGLQMQMEKEGLNFQAMMKLSESLPPEQQAQFIADTAKNAGMKYTEQATKEQLAGINKNLSFYIQQKDPDKWKMYASSLGMSDADAKKAWEGGAINDATLTKSGLKPLAPGSLEQEKEKDRVNKVMQYTTKLQETGMLSKDEADYIAKNGNATKLDNISTKETWDARGSSWGYQAYRFEDAAWEKLNSSIGKLVKDPEGNIVILESVWEPGTKRDDRYKKPYYVTRNPVTGEVKTVDTWS